MPLPDCRCVPWVRCMLCDTSVCAALARTLRFDVRRPWQGNGRRLLPSHRPRRQLRCARKGRTCRIGDPLSAKSNSSQPSQRCTRCCTVHREWAAGRPAPFCSDRSDLLPPTPPLYCLPPPWAAAGRPEAFRSAPCSLTALCAAHVPPCVPLSATGAPASTSLHLLPRVLRIE